MKSKLLRTLSMAKYERLIPRVFPNAVELEIRELNGTLFWKQSANQENADSSDADPVVAWSPFGTGVERRELPCGRTQYRAPLRSRDLGKIAWLLATFETQSSVPMTAAPEPLRRAFSDAISFLQDEIELQSECNQLASELTERYEELNLVYSTKDQVEYFEEGQEALARLVHNCADYLDVGVAALICRDRGLSLHNINSSNAPSEVEALLELLATTVYDRIESQVSSVVLNESDDTERQRLIAGRSENVLAYPIVDNHGTAIGLLAVIANQDAHTFSNGDRNLLEVMSKKASRIIHIHHDSLTGLMNRAGFESSLVTALASTRSSNLQHCLLHIDMDQLHVINDLMGHHEGDNLIRRVAKLLRGILRDSDHLARLGGDEFGVLLSKCDVNQGHAIAEKIRNAIHELTVISASRQLDVSASVGIASINQETEGIVGAMASAEIACKAAKDEGRDRIQVFQEDNTTLVRRSEEIEWIGRVQEALREDKFTMFCQPVSPLSDVDAEHFEVLVRMLDDEGEVLSPALFLPAAERYQLMPLVDRWVIHHTLSLLGSFWDSVASSNAVFCINLSGQSLTNAGFLAFVAHELQSSGVSPQQICFEITETAAISNIDDAITFMESLRQVGCRFSLDDFGAGLSSFGYLKVLPVDYLKIDGSFVREVTSDTVSSSMVQAICQIGSTMGLSIVAEFVGDQETIDVLRDIGVDYVQGYFIGEPAPLDETVERLRSDAQAASA
ncbi:MAG: putative bifunctional diguanylate cyclase/phosphodiesterase [Woeseiaceae bacterium]